MHERVQGGSERRAATRHRLPGNAEVFWGAGAGAQLRISDVSASGCLLSGEGLPDVGTRVVLSLSMGDLPHVRLSGMIVRVSDASDGNSAAVRFLLPARCLPGISRLLETEAQNTPHSA